MYTISGELWKKNLSHSVMSVRTTVLKNSHQQEESVYGIKCRQVIFSTRAPCVFNSKRPNCTSVRCGLKFASLSGSRSCRHHSKTGPPSGQDRVSCQLCLFLTIYAGFFFFFWLADSSRLQPLTHGSAYLTYVQSLSIPEPA